ncbi:OmpA family protein [Altererythrobacter salegens]|uniref:OmpA family protein n=1 Tax=Croceibacterium salegens TaxID=1737568 RepID=A0A6I4SV50_9SPHN|nr:OmpA family protein [Croceibacterium salegens]MXO60044.1 OmpA family protein [Croceibacterium salegens]
MNINSKKPGVVSLIAMLAVAAPGSLYAQELEAVKGDTGQGEVLTTVVGSVPADIAGMPEGPEIEGIISARNGTALQVTSKDGTSTRINISASTEIRAKKGLFGLGSDKLAQDALLNGLPVNVKTVQWGNGLVASRIKFSGDDLETAAMIRNGTAQRFGEHDVAIQQNAAATEALRGRIGDIDQYNVKGVTNVYFDTGKAVLSPKAKADLCATAADADAMQNALMLVVGYTDSVGSQEYNQTLSEKRAGGVVNYLQQACGWKPYRMLTPTGMAEADPLADNSTPEGKAQNRRVSVNILVSKSVDGLGG